MPKRPKSIRQPGGLGPPKSWPQQRRPEHLEAPEPPADGRNGSWPPPNRPDQARSPVHDAVSRNKRLLNHTSLTEPA